MNTIKFQKPKWITIPVEEYESMKSTLEILSSPRWLREELKGKEAVRLGRTKSLDKVKKELGF
jgi:PHD/YefM family antitoxin component YafN of YafNO toxin-antitoxin module